MTGMPNTAQVLQAFSLKRMATLALTTSFLLRRRVLAPARCSSSGSRETGGGSPPGSPDNDPPELPGLETHSDEPRGTFFGNAWSSSDSKLLLEECAELVISLGPKRSRAGVH